MEIVAAILLAIAAVGSAWSAYQAARWSGVMTMNFSEANVALNNSVKFANEAGQQVASDADSVWEWEIAFYEGNTELMQHYETHMFDPELKAAVEAWKATDPSTNPDHPRSPLDMPEYRLESYEKSIELEDVAVEKSQEAGEANQQSDNYILLTVLFASVLFFAGVSTKFSGKQIRIFMVIVGSTILILSFVILSFQKVY